MPVRTKYQIIASFLDIASDGSIRSTIMQRANLTTKQFDNYLPFLVELGLLTVLSDEKNRFITYKTTTKGFTFLAMLDAANSEEKSQTMISAPQR